MVIDFILCKILRQDFPEIFTVREVSREVSRLNYVIRRKYGPSDKSPMGEIDQTVSSLENLRSYLPCFMFSFPAEYRLRKA